MHAHNPPSAISTDSRLRRFVALSLFALSSSNTIACGEDPADETSSKPKPAVKPDVDSADAGAEIDAGAAAGDNEPADAGTDAPSDDAAPLYMAATRIWDDTSITSYFHLVPSLEADEKVDPKQALEVAGSAKLYADRKLGWFALGNGESPTITRYTLGKNDQLVAGDAMSLLDYGVQSLWDSLYVISKNKAYYPDSEGSQLIVWDPSEMRVIGNIPLPETMRDGYTSYYSISHIERGTKVVFSVGWFDWEESDSVRPETGLVVIDTEDDSVASFEVDDRCGGITQVMGLEGGDAYFVSSSLAASAFHLGRLATEPCVLRVRAGDTEFDQEYHLRLQDITGGALAGEPTPFGGDEVLLRVLDDQLAEIPEDAHTWDITGQAAWRWVRWNVETDELKELDLAPSTSDVAWFRVREKVYATQTKTDYSETTLIELTAEGGPKVELTVPGFLHGLARLR